MLLPRILLAAVAVTHAGVLAQVPSKQDCTDPRVRVEWRNLDAADQQGYIDAVLCLKTKPSRRGLDTPLYDDFANVHFELNRFIHGVAAFLPWHRYFAHVYEEALRECGYTGPAAYWDWTLDVQKLAQSPVMSSTLGFGGDGSESRTEKLSNNRSIKCVDSGPFSALRPVYVAFTPEHLAKEEHCLYRDLTDGDMEGAIIMADYYNSTYIDMVQDSADFDTFASLLEANPHGVIHASIGGEMGPSTSPNEPIFFLHHAQVDRLWWQWQQANISARGLEYSGIRAVANSTDGAKASLDDILEMLGLADDIPVKDVMNTRNSRLCYRY